VHHEEIYFDISSSDRQRAHALSLSHSLSFERNANLEKRKRDRRIVGKLPAPLFQERILLVGDVINAMLMLAGDKF
jgi:hypothetical protein